MCVVQQTSLVCELWLGPWPGHVTLVARYVLVVCWLCASYVLVMCWLCVGCVLVMC